jgi:hypothetical protein
MSNCRPLAIPLILARPAVVDQFPESVFLWRNLADWLSSVNTAQEGGAISLNPVSGP